MHCVDDLLALQSGVVSRRQLLALGLTPTEVRRLLRRRELVVAVPGVYLDHTGDPTWLQRAWTAVLALEPAALTHRSALRAADGPGRVPVEGVIHVAVDRTRSPAAPPGVRLHHLAHLHDRVLWNADPPRVRFEHACLDVAAEARETSPPSRCSRTPSRRAAPPPHGCAPPSTRGNGCPAAPSSPPCSTTSPPAPARSSSTATSTGSNGPTVYRLRVARPRPRAVPRSTETSSTWRPGSSSSSTAGCSTTTPAPATPTSTVTSRRLSVAARPSGSGGAGVRPTVRHRPPGGRPARPARVERCPDPVPEVCADLSAVRRCHRLTPAYGTRSPPVC